MAIRPIDDKVVVKRADAQDKTKGGILLPDVSKEAPRDGVVVAVGPGRLYCSGEHARVPMQVKEGDRVLFGAYAGSTVKLAGEELLILAETDILAVVD